MNFIGMDIHKEFTVAVAKDKEGSKLEEVKFENSKENFSGFLVKYSAQETKIVMESTCVWEYIFEIIEELGYDVKLSNNTLCDLLRANLVAESYIPPKEVRRLREITRERKTFVKQMTQIKNKITQS